MISYFQNITKLLNCVECDKCKTYGKLQIKGLGTALNVLFDEQFKVESTIKRNDLIVHI